MRHYSTHVQPFVLFRFQPGRFLVRLPEAPDPVSVNDDHALVIVSHPFGIAPIRAYGGTVVLSVAERTV